MTKTLNIYFNNKEISIHPEYYYNANRVVAQPKAALMASGVVGISGTAFLSTMFLLGYQSLKNFDLPTTAPNVALASIALTGITTAAISIYNYVESGSDTANKHNSICNDIYDSLVFTGEYLLSSYIYSE